MESWARDWFVYRYFHKEGRRSIIQITLSDADFELAKISFKGENLDTKRFMVIDTGSGRWLFNDPIFIQTIELPVKMGRVFMKNASVVLEYTEEITDTEILLQGYKMFRL